MFNINIFFSKIRELEMELAQYKNHMQPQPQPQPIQTQNAHGSDFVQNLLENVS